ARRHSSADDRQPVARPPCFFLVIHDRAGPALFVPRPGIPRQNTQAATGRRPGGWPAGPPPCMLVLPPFAVGRWAHSFAWCATYSALRSAWGDARPSWGGAGAVFPWLLRVVPRRKGARGWWNVWNQWSRRRVAMFSELCGSSH
ncbi:unnamed protein product, partial [Amoebophrya sp. A120]